MITTGPIGTLGQQNASAVAVTGGTIDGTTIGGVQAVDQFPAIDQRPPTLTDDTSRNYSSPDAFWSWHTPSGKTRVFQQQKNNTGYPEWTTANLNNNVLPGDACSVACAAAWWTRQVVSAYTGPLFQAQRSDAATLDVQQLADGNPDQASLWKWAANNMPARVAKWYDQSGNGYDAAQATASLQPLLAVDRDGDLVVVYDQWVSTSQQTRYLTISTSLSLTVNTMTAFTVNTARDLSNYDGSSGYASTFTNFLQLGNTGGTFGIELGSYYTSGLTIWNDGSVEIGGWPSALPALALFVSNASNRSYQLDGYPLHTKTGDLGTHTITGGVLGMTPGGPSGHSVASSRETSQYGAIVFASTLSAADILAAKIAVHALGKTTPQARSNIVVGGESIAQGRIAPAEQSWVKQLQDSLPKSCRVFNFGWSSSGIGVDVSVAPSTTSLYAGSIALPYNSADRANILIINGGNTNDYWNGAGAPLISAATEQAYLTTLLTTAAATGWTKIFVLTPVDRASGSAATYTLMAAMTTAIVAGQGVAATGSYTAIRLDLDPVLGVLGTSASDTTYFPDGIHLSARGAAHVAAIIKRAIGTFIRAGG